MEPADITQAHPRYPWQEFPLPSSLWLQDEASGDDFALRVLQHTLSGLVTNVVSTGKASRDIPSLWIQTTQPDQLWRSRFTQRTGVPSRAVSADVAALVSTYADLGVVKGFVAYTVDQVGAQSDVSVNIATSLCATLQAVAAAGPLIEILEAMGLRKLANASEVTYQDLLAGSYRFNRDLLTILRTEQPHARDLAVASGTLVTLEAPDGGYDDALVTLNPGAAIFGYGADEFKFTYGASTVGAGIVGCDWSSNLATLSSGDPVTIKPLPKRERVVDDGVSFYVAFAITDGDNMQWLINDFTTGPYWYASPHRGEMPFTWGLHTSSLSQVAPDALSWLLENATGNDDFLPYADSYAYLDVMHKSNQSRLSTFVSQRQPISHAAGLDSAVVFMEDWTLTDAYETFAAADPVIKALFSCQYSAYAAGQGRILRTSKGVPVVSPKISMWHLDRNDSEFGEPAHVANVINGWAGEASGGGDKKRPVEERVAWVPVHAWSTFAAPLDAQDLAHEGLLGGYSAALYARRRLSKRVKVVTLGDIADMLQVK
ncbi:hypothetical protein PpBr36_02557 [Pyricularia pennisetigena]|uniref:hypothetical protein n=1 Tax=Pyricularia pennisetigena TaxID=1578925 RepID=UPI00114F4D7D|nr:hypothetical protein PpBr36_02557 [Pyricularia pennisetigena]TLS31620.1 hypothetical protein PpBr36_02557 [Pyricularia pennisetigena]